MPALADTLYNEVRCLNCGWGDTAQSLRIAYIRRAVLARTPTADVSLAGLAVSANCFLCLGISGADAIELALLSLLSA